MKNGNTILKLIIFSLLYADDLHQGMVIIKDLMTKGLLFYIKNTDKDMYGMHNAHLPIQ